MALNPLTALSEQLQKLINEHGSAAILRDHLAMFKDQVALLEKDNVTLKQKMLELESQNKELESRMQSTDVSKNLAIDFTAESANIKKAGSRLNNVEINYYEGSRRGRGYAAPKKVCAACELRDQCTRNKAGRTVKRHLRQDELNTMRQRSQSVEARQDIKTRQHLMERSFARSTRYDFDHARWRGLWRMRIQELLVCSIQNIQVLIKQTNKPKKAVAAKVKALKTTLNELISPTKALIATCCFKPASYHCFDYQRT